MTDIGWSLHRKTAPIEPVLSLGDLKDHRRVTWNDEDSLIERLGRAVESELEKKLSVSLMSQVWELRLDRFPCRIELPRPTVGDEGPFVTLAADAVKYLDSAGVEQTLNASLYTLDAYSYPPCIYPAFDQAWPTTYGVPKAVTITYTAGKSDPEDVDAAIWLELWRRMGDAYEHRENVITGTIVNELPFSKGIIAEYRCVWTPPHA